MDKQYTIKERNLNRQFYTEDSTTIKPQAPQLRERLLSEGNEDFYSYLDWIGLSKYPDLLVLSASHHYYYDAEDMKDVKALVNLKTINEIKQVKAFLNNIYDIIPERTYFLGYFRDSDYSGSDLKKGNEVRRQQAVMAEENGISSGIPFLNMMYNILDQKTNRNMSKTYVRLLLKEAGFRVLDITELNGLTYFCVQKSQAVQE